MARADFDEAEGGWRQNPKVGCAAGVVVFITLVFALSKICCNGGGGDKVVGDEVTMVCPHCKHVYEVERDSVGVEEEASADAFQGAACNVPCPECGKKDSVPAQVCNKCGKHYAPPKTAEELKDFKCTHCGKKPWGK